MDAEGNCICIAGELLIDGECELCDALIDDIKGCEECDAALDGTIICKECLAPLVLSDDKTTCEFDLCAFYRVMEEITGGFEYLYVLMDRAKCTDCEDGNGLRDDRCFSCSGTDLVLPNGTIVNSMEALEYISDPRDGSTYLWKGCIDCLIDEESPFMVKDCIECVDGEELTPNPDWVLDGTEGPPNFCAPINPPVIPNCVEVDLRGAYCYDCEDGYRISFEILMVWMYALPYNQMV